MAKTAQQNLKLGIFVILGTLLLLIAAYLIGNRQNMFTKNFTITAIFKNANGLQNGNNVRFSGINVGTVNKIEMINDTTIQVFMAIQEKMQSHIKNNAVATIGSDGLVGSMLVNIVPGQGEAPLIKAGDELQSFSKIATQDMLNTLNVTNENAALLTADLLQVTQSLTKSDGTLGSLLNNTTMAKNLQQTMANLNQVSSKANTSMYQINNILGQINLQESAAGVLLNDTLSARKIKTVIYNLEASSIEINNMSKELGSIISDLNDEKGMLYYVAKDTVLVKQLKNTMKHIDQGTERFNENMEALKHNFLTRGYFKKQEKLNKKKDN
ncbi:hypothetical protein GCM10011414_11180 [Croceivirga lutea]|uniref:MlaD family protein n=1 Tax=Croceivirga lutea TaxID=1775167 RepID=UPI00163B5699|nr:MlaD family protein [Croceivirga lutea]GGG43284.1 hypothetical protein GCM10011414_11180 [Croceivirga lutea]